MTLAHDRFESAAKAQAKIQGLPDLPIVVVAQDVYHDTRLERVKQAADSLYETVVKSLIAPTKAKVR